MDYEEIAKAITAEGYSWGTAAAAMNKSTAALQKVAKRNMTSHFIARGICALIGKEVATVFPDKPEYQDAPPKTKREHTVARAKATLEAAGLQVA